MYQYKGDELTWVLIADPAGGYRCQKINLVSRDLISFRFNCSAGRVACLADIPFRILDMGQRLGRFITKSRTDYFTPDKRNGQVIYTYKPLPYAEDAIYRQNSDITISMKTADHLHMPKLVSSEYTVRLSEDEQEKYTD